jgi:DNA-binding response OmpR family regulator
MQRIAVIEDDAATSATLQVLLTDEGYEVLLIEGPGDLLAQLAATKPDLVLLDLMLGGWGDGLALACAIRREPGWKRLPLIVMSAAADRLDQHAFILRDLRCPVLEKPFDLDDLLALIAGELVTAQS